MIELSASRTNLVNSAKSRLDGIIERLVLENLQIQKNDSILKLPQMSAQGSWKFSTVLLLYACFRVSECNFDTGSEIECTMLSRKV